jgi:hypothetical protein
MSKKINVTEQIDIALAEVTAAEDELAKVLGELRAGVRAEKVAISETVEKAFSRLRKGRQALSELREQLTEE